MLIESLIALIVSSIVSLLAVSFLQMCTTLLKMKDTSQLEFSILQLRQELALSQSAEVKENRLNTIVNHEERIYFFDKNRLVKTPGYEIFIENIQEGMFYEEDQKIYLELEKKRYQIY